MLSCSEIVPIVLQDLLEIYSRYSCNDSIAAKILPCMQGDLFLLNFEVVGGWRTVRRLSLRENEPYFRRGSVKEKVNNTRRILALAAEKL